MVVHYMQYGRTACLMPSPPKDWPDGHRWSNNWDDVTCPGCRAGKELVPTFSLSGDGKAITCLRCGRQSHNPHDVEHHYCAQCKVFHDDLWPAARKWWLTH